uniref:Putative secreted protein n=1 Tax=Ixodes ricinus TaxID=34613 RepID=A0A0K8RLD5_IXORI
MVKSGLAALLCCLTLASAHVTWEQENCPELEADWMEKIDKMLAHLPESYTTVRPDLMTFGEVILGNTSIRNLRRGLEVNQSYKTFCSGIGRIIVISMQCRDECLRAIVPWSFTNVEHSGNVVLFLKKLQLVVHISVTGSEGYNVFNVLTVVPGQVEVGGVQIDGAASWVNLLIEKLEPLFRGLLELSWRTLVLVYLPGAFRHAAEQSGL